MSLKQSPVQAVPVRQPHASFTPCAADDPTERSPAVLAVPIHMCHHASDRSALCCRYKAAKAELAEIESELLVLERTLTVLAQQEAAALAQLGAVERERGVTGYGETWVSSRAGYIMLHSSGC